jgi:ubiquinone/menaquinone biosynthesis C-methylase UbiE
MDLQQIVDIFDARAERYATDDWHRRYAEQLVAVTPLRLGDRVLDAGTGTGFAACAIGRRVGSPGRVLGVDISPKMLDQARRLVDTEGLTNVDFLEGDASDVRHLDASTFDAVVCSAGLLYMPVEASLRAWHRLLKQDGFAAFSTMRAGSPPPGRVFRQCAAAFGLDLKDPSEPLGTEDRCRHALTDAGFDRVEIIAGHVDFETIDPVLVWEAHFRSPGYGDVRTLSDEQRLTLRERFIDALREEMITARGASMRAEVLFAIGRRR